MLDGDHPPNNNSTNGFNVTDLFSPLLAGDLSLANRIVMAPLTRSRAGADGVPTEIMAEHYAQRASVGLIISEGTFQSLPGKAFDGQPGLVTTAQLAGWRKVTDAVHAEGGLIVAQVMHAGRATHPDISGFPVEAPSALAIDGETHAGGTKVAYPLPRALETDELPEIVETFVRSSQNAVDAGFDGVELHAANGYLLHEFLSPNTNERTDQYGGSPENRARFVVEVTTAVAEAIGAGKVGIRLSPMHNVQGMQEVDEADVRATYGHLVDQLRPLGLAYLSVLHSEPGGELVQELRARFGGPLVANSGFGRVTTREEAVQLIDAAHADAVAVGRAVIANPDLVERWAGEHPENEPIAATFYAAGAEGYTDYPFLKAG